MKKILTTAIIMTITLVMNAQVENKNVDVENKEAIPSIEAQEMRESMGADEIGAKPFNDEAAPQDTINRRVMSIPTYAMGRPYLFSMGMPMAPFGWDGLWDIHEGLNGQVGMGVMVGFGKNNPFKGASFYSDVSLLYAKQINKHWSVALGGTMEQFKIWNKNEIMGSVYGIGNYKFDDHWNASIYASYNHMPEGISMFDPYFGSPDMMRFNENFARVGGEVTYKFNNGNSISVGVSADVPVGNNRPWVPQHPVNQDHNKIGNNH